MITFDALTLKALTTEWAEFLDGARISKIQQPTRRDFIFTLRNFGQSKLFYVNINPQFYHACFLNKTNFEKRVLEIPQKPPMFCMLLRKYLENSKIARINQPQNERILEFYIESYNELGENIYLCLAFEFMGKHSNVILYNYDTNIIIGCAHNVGAEKSREREIYGSLPYVYPPKQQKTDLLNYNGEINYQTLSDDFYMISKSFADLCAGKPAPKIKSFIRLENLSPCISADFKTYSLFKELMPPDAEKYNSVNNMIDDYYAYYIGQNKFDALKTQYNSITSQKLKKVIKALKQMEYSINSGDKADKYRLYGDLLMANLYQLKDYTESASVYDYENNLQIVIPLDKLKTVKDNANNFYKLYNKAKSAKSKLSELIEEYKSRKSYLEQVLYSITSADNIKDLLEISDEVLENNATTKKKTKIKLPEIMKITPDDSTIIYIGKNNKQNDYIISKLADENDLWFHTHNCAGSHVLLKTQNLTDELILKCAKLAKEYSSAKNSSKIGVIYTKRKYIRKPPGANLGYVTYKNEKEIILD